MQRRDRLLCVGLGPGTFVSTIGLCVLLYLLSCFITILQSHLVRVAVRDHDADLSTETYRRLDWQDGAESCGEGRASRDAARRQEGPRKGEGRQGVKSHDVGDDFTSVDCLCIATGVWRLGLEYIVGPGIFMGSIDGLFAPT